MKTKTKNTVDVKISALAKYLDCEPDEIDEDASDLFSHGRDEYLVLTDDEADEKAPDYIRESVWAFRKSFLDGHSEAIRNIDDQAWDKFQEGCERVNAAIWAMIDDKEHFINEAILCDGRGNFLAGYDSEENESKADDGEYLYIYRVS